MNLPIDQQIDLAHAEVERIESEARLIEARIIAAGGIPPKRPYGKPVSSADVGRNLTLKSILQRRDPALAAFLGVGSDLHRREQEAEGTLHHAGCGVVADEARARVGAPMRWRRSLRLMRPEPNIIRQPNQIQGTSGLW